MSEAVDLDKTLAFHKDWGTDFIGKPIPKMMRLVKSMLAQGKDVVIFTARANNAKEIGKVQDWLEEHGLPRLRVTNIKLPEFERIWDDRAVAVVPNKGIIIRGNGTSAKHRVSMQK